MVVIDGPHLIDQHLLWRRIVRRLENGDAIQMVAGRKFRPYLLSTVSIGRRIHGPHRSSFQQLTKTWTIAAIQNDGNGILSTAHAGQHRALHLLWECRCRVVGNTEACGRDGGPTFFYCSNPPHPRVPHPDRTGAPPHARCWRDGGGSGEGWEAQSLHHEGGRHIFLVLRREVPAVTSPDQTQPRSGMQASPSLNRDP